MSFAAAGGTTMQKVAVIGSGFGGSVMACRLAQSGRFEVHVLERGKRYGRNEFPRRPEDVANVLWNPDEGCFGPFEWRSFSSARTDAVAAAGLGGGSLIYSSVLYRVPERLLNGWPGGITRKVLDPYYDRALEMLEGALGAQMETLAKELKTLKRLLEA